MALKPMPTPQEQAQRAAAGAVAAKQRFIDGVNRNTVNPMEAAAAAVDTMVANFNAAHQNGRIVKGLRRKTFDQYKAATTGKGATNYVTGVNAAIPNNAAVIAAMRPGIEALRQRIDGMAKGTIEERIARSVAWQEGMNALKLARN